MQKLAGIAVVLAMTAMGLACGGSADQASVPPETMMGLPPAESGREAAPPLAGLSLDGEPISVGDFRGRPVLINVWSSW